MQRRGWYPRHINDISAEQVLGKKQRASVIFTRGHLSSMEERQYCICKGALKCGVYCKECQLDMEALEGCECEKTAVYELLRTSMVGGPAQVLTRYHEKDITRIRSNVYGEKTN